MSENGARTLAKSQKKNAPFNMDENNNNLNEKCKHKNSTKHMGAEREITTQN